MPKYIVKDTHIHHDGKPYGPGDEIDLTEAQAAILSVEAASRKPYNKSSKGETDASSTAE